MADHKRFQVLNQDDVTILRLADAELSDLLLQNELHDELMTFVASERPHKLLVSFRSVNYCTTGVINSLLSTKKRVVSAGGEFKLCELARPVREAFRVLNLEGTVFDVCDTEADGVASF